MINFKRYIALLLLCIVTSYSVDLHGLSHMFDNHYADDDKQCEICILHHQQHETTVSILPVFDYSNNQISLDNFDLKVEFSTYNFIYQNLFFEGQFYNKPPPYFI